MDYKSNNGRNYALFLTDFIFSAPGSIRKGTWEWLTFSVMSLYVYEVHIYLSLSEFMFWDSNVTMALL